MIELLRSSNIVSEKSLKKVVKVVDDVSKYVYNRFHG